MVSVGELQKQQAGSRHRWELNVGAVGGLKNGVFRGVQGAAGELQAQ